MDGGPPGLRGALPKFSPLHRSRRVMRTTPLPQEARGRVAEGAPRAGSPSPTLSGHVHHGGGAGMETPGCPGRGRQRPKGRQTM